MANKFSYITLAAALAASMGLVACGGAKVPAEAPSADDAAAAADGAAGDAADAADAAAGDAAEAGDAAAGDAAAAADGAADAAAEAAPAAPEGGDGG